MAKVKHLAAESEIEKSDVQQSPSAPLQQVEQEWPIVTIKMKTTRQLEVDLNLALVQAMPLYLTHCVSHTVTNP